MGRQSLCWLSFSSKNPQKFGFSWGMDLIQANLISESKYNPADIWETEPIGDL